SAAVLAVITHPGMCSLGGACFVTVWPPDGEEPVTVEGAHEMPGRGVPEERFGSGGTEVELDFAGGVRTTVGPASVATPGLLAAFQETADRFGALPWASLFGPAVERARRGFPMPASCRVFLSHAHEAIYGQDPRSRRALHDEDDRLLEAGETIRVDGLADTLETLAREGAEAFYRGEIGRRIAEHVRSEGGLLGRRDLAEYRPRVRRPLRVELDEWDVATNPPPALGGGVLAASLSLLPDTPREGWSAGDVRRLADALEAVGRYRIRELTSRIDPEPALRRLLERADAAAGDPRRLQESPSTIHTSAVDADGTGCSITCSDGYGSGVMPPGTGLWLNNALGEHDLSGGAFHALEPGRRLTSNMAPTAARRPDGAALAVGSPGAER
ncbi:MAG: gamma-glutamyltransferase, partial [Gemmatimonadota bacterium]